MKTPFHQATMLSFDSEKAIKKQGGFLLVGKEYIIREGDILNIRFNV